MAWSARREARATNLDSADEVMWAPGAKAVIQRRLLGAYHPVVTEMGG